MYTENFYKQDFNDSAVYTPSYFHTSPVYSSSSSSYSSASNTPEPETFIKNEEKNIKIPIKTMLTASKKQYQCHLCFKNFSRPSALQTHSYTHTAEKPFQCLSPGCGRRFSVVSNLRRHFKVHQKPAVSDKISSEDRLHYVRQLIKASNAILMKQNEVYDNQQHKNEKFVPNLDGYQNIHSLTTTTASDTTAYHNQGVIDEEHHKKQQQQQKQHSYSKSIVSSSFSSRYHHYILLPAISNVSYDNLSLPVTNMYTSMSNSHLPGASYGDEYLGDNMVDSFNQHHIQPAPCFPNTLQTTASLSPIIHFSVQQEHDSYYTYVDEKSDAYNDSSMNYYS